MKQLKTIVLALVAGTVFYSCEHAPPAMDPPVVDVPSSIIPIQEADQWFLNYGDERVEIIESAINEMNPDLPTPYKTTRFVTLDYDALKQYLAFVDQESRAAQVQPKGLRFYFGVTPPSGKELGKETIFLNPVAAFDGVDGDISYAIATNPTTGEKTAITVGSVIDGKTSPKGERNLILQGDGIQSLAGDDVTWPPPPHPGDPNDYH